MNKLVEINFSTPKKNLRLIGSKWFYHPSLFLVTNCFMVVTNFTTDFK